eukprot:9901496-Alexandrium_andersonii.AAC.1
MGPATGIPKWCCIPWWQQLQVSPSRVASHCEWIVWWLKDGPNPTPHPTSMQTEVGKAQLANKWQHDGEMVGMCQD